MGLAACSHQCESQGMVQRAILIEFQTYFDFTKYGYLAANSTIHHPPLKNSTWLLEYPIIVFVESGLSPAKLIARQPAKFEAFCLGILKLANIRLLVSACIKSVNERLGKCELGGVC